MVPGNLIRSKKRWCLCFLFLALVFSVSKNGIASEERQAIAVAEAVLRESPGFLSKAVGKFPYGTIVQVLEHDRGWLKIMAGKKIGWVQKSALQDSEYVLKDLGRGKKATMETYKNDVVTAGKGFSPEYEAVMKESNGKLNYSAVDDMEKLAFKEIELFKFARKVRVSSDLLE